MRRIVFIAYPQVDLLDLTGPMQVFHSANLAAHTVDAEPLDPTMLVRRPSRVDPYEIRVVTPQSQTMVETWNGLRIEAHDTLQTLDRRRIDTLLVPGGDPRALAADNDFRSWLREVAKRTRRVGSVCSGAFILAAAGLLDGRTATTHWIACRELARRFPRVRVEPDRIYVKDGPIYSSAGSTAGMDLALALVEEDLGPQLAIRAARMMVMYMRRSGGQSQFSHVLAAQAASHGPLQRLIPWIAEHLRNDLTVEALAERADMSVRHFTRVFHTQVGTTPARFVERVRVDAARRSLEESVDGLDAVAAVCGFGSADSMRRSFLRTLGVPPSEYRQRFGG